MGLFVLGEQYIPCSVCWSDEFLTWPLWYKLFYCYLSFWFLKMRYDGAWNLLTGSVMASGLGYNGRDPKTNEHKWDKIVLIESFKI